MRETGDGMGSFWWIVSFISAWGVLLLSTDKERFKTSWTDGLWSVGLAMVCEGLIRRSAGFFDAQTLIFPFLGTDLLYFLGPRFVEGVLFMQILPPRNKLLRVALWISLVTGAERLSPLTEDFARTWHGFELALAVHSLRFLSLLGIHGALNFGPVRERLLNQRQNRQKSKLFSK